MGYPFSVEPQGATTSRRAAARGRRQREHGHRLREQAHLQQLTERRRVRRKLADARQLWGRRVASSRRRGLLAKAKCLHAAEQSREAAHRARERSERMARLARERAKAFRS
jgi:hypothetical protein